MEESEISSFFVLSHIRMIGYFGPVGLEPPAGFRKRRKATVKKRRNTAPGFKALDP